MSAIETGDGYTPSTPTETPEPVPTCAPGFELVAIPGSYGAGECVATTESNGPLAYTGAPIPFDVAIGGAILIVVGFAALRQRAHDRRFAPNGGKR